MHVHKPAVPGLATECHECSDLMSGVGEGVCLCAGITVSKNVRRKLGEEGGKERERSAGIQ